MSGKTSGSAAQIAAQIGKNDKTSGKMSGAAAQIAAHKISRTKN